MDEKLDAILEKGLKGNRRYQAFVEPGSWIYPAEDFEKETGLKGISRQYTIPDGRTSEEAHFHLITKEIKADMAASLLDDVRKLGAPVSAERAKDFNAAAKDELSGLKNHLKELQASGADYMDVESIAVDVYRAQSKVSYSKTLVKLVEHFGDGLESKLEDAAVSLRKDYEREMVGFYDKLERLNPELKTIPADRGNIRQLRDVVDGALSHFNPDDIKAFSIDRFTGIEARKDAEWVKNNDAIETGTGTAMYWIASKPTQEKTLALLEEKAKSSPTGHAAREEQRRSHGKTMISR
ncbi:MAG: hypothetical protein FJX23_04875 [Alphaproteobacteria bacterium]|nr:hypothetical protein [Alphaproteobacteria bacterium]